MKLNILRPEQIITNDWSIIKIATERCPSTWEATFEAAKEELKDISDILEEDKKANGRFYPDCDKVFRAFVLTPLPKVNVVLFGQDPKKLDSP